MSDLMKDGIEVCRINPDGSYFILEGLHADIYVRALGDVLTETIKVKKELTKAQEEIEQLKAVVEAADKVSDELQCVYYPSLGGLDEALSNLKQHKEQDKS